MRITVEDWYTYEEAADIAGRTIAGIRSAVKCGNLKGRKIFGRDVVHKTDLTKYMRKIEKGKIRRGPKSLKRR